MDFTDNDKILNLLLGYGFEGAVIGLVVFVLIKYFLPGYLSQKGKNLATQEDIENITNKIEFVKSSYAKILEDMKSNNQIKIAAIEREKSIKKEVYMEAAEAITRSQNMIANFSNLNLSEEALTADFSSESGKIAKIQIVGSGETVRAVTMMMNSIGESVLNLMLIRSPLLQRKNIIENNQMHRDKSLSEVDRYLSIMKNLNLQGNADKGTWDTINRQIDYENEQVEKYNQELNSLWEIQNTEHLAYTQKCMDMFFEVSSLMPDAILAVRKELNMEISPQEYLDIYNEGIKKGKLIFSDFLKKVEAS